MKGSLSKEKSVNALIRAHPTPLYYLGSLSVIGARRHPSCPSSRSNHKPRNLTDAGALRLLHQLDLYYPLRARSDHSEYQLFLVVFSINRGVGVIRTSVSGKTKNELF